MKELLILGGSGFTGGNMLTYFGARPESYHIYAPAHHELDVLDECAVRDCLQKGRFDAVINCLDVRGNPSNFAVLRLKMFANLYKYRDTYGKMIYFGSGAEYHRADGLHEVSETTFGEKIPDDDYGLFLYYMSLLTEQSENIYNFRLFGIFGRYEDWTRRFISNAILKKLCGYPITLRSDRRMSYLDVEDLCRMTEWAIQSRPRYHTYNAGPAKSYSLCELAGLINQTSEPAVPVFIARPAVASEYTCSCKRLQAEYPLIYTDMKQSIEQLTAWYRPQLQTIDRYALLYQQ